MSDVDSHTEFLTGKNTCPDCGEQFGSLHKCPVILGPKTKLDFLASGSRTYYKIHLDNEEAEKAILAMTPQEQMKVVYAEKGSDADKVYALALVMKKIEEQVNYGKKPQSNILVP